MLKVPKSPELKACFRCNAPILSRYPRVRFCSPKCWNEEQRSKRKKKTCPICGKEFEVSRYKNWRLKTCSRACGWKLERRRTPMKCFHCGKDFWRHHSQSSRKFCSQKCVGEYSREQVLVKCAQCGKAFTRGRAFIKRVKNSFCDTVCSRKFHRGPRAPRFRGGERHYRGPDWQLQARKARKRDHNICRVCGKPKQKGEALSVDHIVPYRMFPCNDLRNLLSICRAPCHSTKTQAIEPKILAGDKLGFIQGLQGKGWPMDAVETALGLFEGNPQMPLIGNAP